MSTFVHVILFVGGLVIVIAVLDAALRTFVLPRPSGVTISRIISVGVRWVFDAITRPIKSYEGRDRVMALYGPITLLTMAFGWVLGVFIGYTMMFVAVTDLSWKEALRSSGSALFTLGFAVPATGPAVILDFTEAGLGLLLIALLIAYLPTIYSGFSRREVVVTRMSVRAGTPPTPTNLLTRAHKTRYLDRLEQAWGEWELWFVELEETHTSLSILNFFRSPNPHRSWLTTSGCILDSAAIRLSTLNITYDPAAATCIRAGYLVAPCHRRLLPGPLRPRPRAGRPDLHHAGGVHRRLRRARGQRRSGPTRPRSLLARLPRLARQLRRGARCDRRAHHGAVRAVVVRPVTDERPAQGTAAGHAFPPQPG